jgi:hypothetical protein
MDGIGRGRSILAIVVVAAIVVLIAFARGEPGHGDPGQSPTAALATSAG